jgi:hypothetical protein
MRMSGRALKPVTFGQHARAWLAGRKLRASALADRTRDSYRSLLDAYALPTFGSVPLNGDHPRGWSTTGTSCARSAGRPLRRGVLVAAHHPRDGGGPETHQHREPRRVVVRPTQKTTFVVRLGSVDAAQATTLDSFQRRSATATVVFPLRPFTPSHLRSPDLRKRRIMGGRSQRKWHQEARACTRGGASTVMYRTRRRQLSATLENEADPTLENEATGSSSSSLPRLGF